MKTYFGSAVILLLALLILGAPTGSAQDYRIGWYSINSGGGLVSGGSYKLNGSVGQPAAGFAKSGSFLHWISFWAGDVLTPVVKETIDQAKVTADGVFVSVAGKIATTGKDPVTNIPDRFTGFFYIEEEDRSSGIRVSCPIWPVGELLRGSTINVIGTMGTTSAGERQIVAPIVIIGSTTDVPPPLGMNNRWLGGSDLGSPPLGQYGVTGGTGLNNVGLLVKIWGRVTETGNGYVVIDDGTGIGVRVDTTTIAAPPGSNQYVTVIGASSLYKPAADRLRLVLPRDDSDIGWLLGGY